MFTHVPTRAVAELLNATLCHRSASVHVAPSMSRPGCYQPKRQLMGGLRIPPGKRAFPRHTSPPRLLPTENDNCLGELRSSRRLESETRRNVEVMWLCQGARPSTKTIADFRKNNATALQKANRDFVLMCREMALLGGSRVVIDGTHLKADANRSSFHTKATLERDLKRLDATIVAYLRELDAADAQSEKCAEDPVLGAKVEAAVEKLRTKKALQERMQESGESQISEVDADARLLRKGDKTVVGYNCQIAMDDKHKLIVAVDVVQDGNDTRQLEPIMTQSRAATGSAQLSGLADAGYFSGEQLKSCEAQGMEVYLPIPKHASRKGKGGRFGSDDFRYDAQDDTYVCPAGQRLVRDGSNSNKGKLYFNYRTTAAVCRECSLSGAMFGQEGIAAPSAALGACGCDRPASPEDARWFAH